MGILKILNDPKEIEAIRARNATDAAVKPKKEDPEADDFTESKTARQELISWWKQSVLRDARVLVVGAGAIGNETLKNMAMMGFGYVYICDMDHISTSNLSRTVLFTPQDTGKRKVAVAAERFKAMNVEATAEADTFDGNICTSLGSGVFNHVDLVVGCLDNLQTRFEVNRHCVQMQIPFIDAGIGELVWNVTTSHYPKSPCWACSMTQEIANATKMLERQSCDVTKKKALESGHAATVQVASSMVSSLQVQEAVKYLTHHDWELGNGAVTEPTVATPPAAAFGKKYAFNGAYNTFIAASFPEREDCDDHDVYENVVSTEISADWTLKQLFDYVDEKYGGGYYLSIASDDRYQRSAFVTYGHCCLCGKPIRIFKSEKVLTDDDLFCDTCVHHKKFNSDSEECVRFYSNDEPDILALTLRDIGVPYMHILEMYKEDDVMQRLLLELTADMPKVMPKLYSREQEKK